MATIFFSWQSDTASLVGRNFIEKALEKAISELKQESVLELVEPDRDDCISLDKDTKGVPGSPPIFDTILKKIDAASVFVADLTYVDSRKNGEKIPNPNVLVEYGWALKSLTHSRLIGVMNVAYGAPSSHPLPFDLRHSRHPITFDLPCDSDLEKRKNAQIRLVADLKVALRAILSQARPEVRVDFSPLKSVDGRGRFRLTTDPLGLQHDRHAVSPQHIFLEEGPVAWIRMWPKYRSKDLLKTTEIENCIRRNNLGLSLLVDYSSIGFVRGVDGFGIYAFRSDSASTPSVAYVFQTGEIWVCDVTERDENGVLFFNEKDFLKAFKDSLKFVRDILKLAPPYLWQAGIEGLRDLRLHIHPDGYRTTARTVGPALKDVAIASGEVTDSAQPKGAPLKPFFESLYDAFGEGLPTWHSE